MLVKDLEGKQDSRAERSTIGEYPATQDNFSQYKSALKLLCSAHLN